MSDSDKASYDEGYQTGKNWKDSYVPGGPYAGNEIQHRLREFWREGFNDGLEVNCHRDRSKVNPS